MGKNLTPNSSLLVFSVSIFAAVLLSIPISGALASDNSGPGRGDDDNQTSNSSPLTTQNLSGPVINITIPLDAESHGAANPYLPNPATVSSGSAVTWINADDEDQHTATADDGSFSTGLINPGSSGRAVINEKAGTTVAYHCDVHPEMRGILQISAGTNNLPASNTIVAQSLDLNSTMLQIANQPLAVGNYTTGPENSLGNDTIQASVMGSTVITLPNSSETITTNDTGTVTIAFTKSGAAILNAQLNLKTEDGLDNATITATEFFSSASAPGRGIAFFSTNSTGKLAALNGVVALTLDTPQPDGSAQVSFFEWRAGSNIQTNVPANATSANTTTTEPTGQGGSRQVSITPGSSSKTQDAFDPNPVQVSIGDTVIWTNNDSTPHTVTSGANGQPDGRFDSSPNFNPLLAPGQDFSHSFTDAGEYPYYCGLHPNMVGIVSVG
jgi:plastocyanin